MTRKSPRQLHGLCVDGPMHGRVLKHWSEAFRVALRPPGINHTVALVPFAEQIVIAGEYHYDRGIWKWKPTTETTTTSSTA